MIYDPQKDRRSLKFKFKQQIMEAWQPVPSLTKAIIMFTFFGALIMSLAIVLEVYSNRIKDYKIRYDDICGDNTTCVLQVTLPQFISGPVFVYYQIHHFYQNHRIYVRSLSQSQLRGNYKSPKNLDQCDPIIYNRDLYTNVSILGTALDPDGPANPCGLIAYTFFNDTYTLTNSSGEIYISDSGIDWRSDDHFFKPKLLNEMWLNTSNQRVRVWMHVAGMPDFRKLWGRINGDMSEGNYTLNITNSKHSRNSVYNVSTINGKKYWVISQVNDLGGKNFFLAIVFFIAGGISFLFAAIFLIMKIVQERRNRKQRQHTL